MTASENALTYVGQKEVAGNSDFVDPAFKAEMVEEGWQRTWAWCAVFMKVVYKNVYTGYHTQLDKLFSPAAVRTYNNFKVAGAQPSKTPAVNNLVVWEMYKNGKATGKGHIGCVSKVDGDVFHSVEGNTNGAGSREGDQVAEKKRDGSASAYLVANGLRLLGFINVDTFLKNK